MQPSKKCSNCGGTSRTHRTFDAVPANDLMKCELCDKITYRYEDTKFEGSKFHGAKKYSACSRHICPGCKCDDELLPLPAGVYPAKHRFRCKLCETKFTVFEDGTSRIDNPEK